MKNKPIIYIGGPGFNYENFTPLIDEIEEVFLEIIKSIKVKTPGNIYTKISLSLEVVSPDEVRAYAHRLPNQKGHYRIRVTSGFFYRIWLASRVFTTGLCLPNWISKIRINDPQMRKIGRKALLSDFAYRIIIYYVLFHELSHILLGHCDYLSENMSAEGIDEFDKSDKFTDWDIKVRKAFEAEADRMAGAFTVSLFDNSLGANGLGVGFTFPSRVHVFEFYVYAVTAVFTYFQQHSAGVYALHPLPRKRQYILCSAMWKYLSEKAPESYEVFSVKSVDHMFSAARRLGIHGNDVDTVAMAKELTFVDDVVNITGINRYAHTPAGL